MLDKEFFYKRESSLTYIMSGSSETMDQQYKCNLDDSFEMKLLCTVETDNEFIKLEREIILYLKRLGLQMKTDPKAKQDQFFNKVKKRQVGRANTMIYQKTQTSDVSSPENNSNDGNQKDGVQLQFNTILMRRTPNLTPQSSPLIVQQQQPQPLQARKSHFNKMKHQESFSSSDDPIDNDYDYFKNI